MVMSCQICLRCREAFSVIWMSKMNILKDNKQSKQTLMAKSAEPQQLQDRLWWCHQHAMFWAFSDQQSIDLSVQSIDSFHQHSCPVKNQGFCKQVWASYTKVALFSSKHWVRMSPFLVALSILWVAACLKSSLQLKKNAVEWMKGVPLFGLILKL